MPHRLWKLAPNDGGGGGQRHSIARRRVYSKGCPFSNFSLSLSLTLFMRKPLSSSSLASDTKIGRRRHLRFNRMLPFENSAPFCSLAVEDINYSFVHNLKKVSAPLLNLSKPPTTHSTPNQALAPRI